MTSSLVTLRASGASLSGASRWHRAKFKTFGDAQLAIFGTSEHRAIWTCICAFRLDCDLGEFVDIGEVAGLL